MQSPRQDRYRNDRPRSYYEAKNVAYRAWATIGIIILFAAAVYAVGMLGSTLELVLVGILIGFVCSPITNFLEDQGVPRAGAAFISLLVVVGVIVMVFAVLLPPFIEQASGLVQRLPGYFIQMRIGINRFWAQLGDLVDPEIRRAALDLFSSISGALSGMASEVMEELTTGILPNLIGTVSNLFTFFLGLVLGYWLALDYPLIVREMAIIAGPEHKDEITLLLAVMSRSMGGYVRGTVITSLLVGVLSVVGFLLAGHPYAVLVGATVGILHIIPVIGSWIAVALAVLLALFSGPIVAISTLIISLVVVNVVDNMISPLIMQSAVNVHPVLSLVAIMIGSALGGIVGMIVAIPLSAAMKGGFVYFFETRTGRQLVSYDGAFFRSTPFHDADGNIVPTYDALDDDKFFENTRLVDTEAPVVQADERSAELPETMPEVLHRRFEQIRTQAGEHVPNVARHHGSQRTSDGRTAAVGRTGRWRVRGDEPAAPQDESQAVVPDAPQNDPQDEMGEGKDS